MLGRACVFLTQPGGCPPTPHQHAFPSPPFCLCSQRWAVHAFSDAAPIACSPLSAHHSPISLPSTCATHQRRTRFHAHTTPTRAPVPRPRTSAGPLRFQHTCSHRLPPHLPPLAWPFCLAHTHTPALIAPGSDGSALRAPAGRVPEPERLRAAASRPPRRLTAQAPQAPHRVLICARQYTTFFIAPRLRKTVPLSPLSRHCQQRACAPARHSHTRTACTPRGAPWPPGQALLSPLPLPGLRCSNPASLLPSTLQLCKALKIRVGEAEACRAELALLGSTPALHPAARCALVHSKGVVQKQRLRCSKLDASPWRASGDSLSAVCRGAGRAKHAAIFRSSAGALVKLFCF